MTVISCNIYINQTSLVSVKLFICEKKNVCIYDTSFLFMSSGSNFHLEISFVRMGCFSYSLSPCRFLGLGRILWNLKPCDVVFIISGNVFLYCGQISVTYLNTLSFTFESIFFMFLFLILPLSLASETAIKASSSAFR